MIAWAWQPQVGQAWRSQSLGATYLLLREQGADSNYFRFVGLNVEDGGLYYVNILNSPTRMWERLS